MKKVVWKFFLDFEKEEKWLNKMAAKGFAFSGFFLGRYTFKEGAPGEYIYRIELLENLPSHFQSKEYLAFMQEQDVELIATWMRWVFLRRKAELGAFNVFSDLDSRLAHYQRILLILAASTLLLFISAVNQGILLLSVPFPEPAIASFSLFLFVLSSVLTIILFFAWNSRRRRIKRLKEERLLWEL